MKSVYLAGPIAGLTLKQATMWRLWAKQRLSEHGIRGISPLRDTLFMPADKRFSKTLEAESALRPTITPKSVVTQNRLDASTSDALVVNLHGATAVSIGTVAEMAWADAARRPVIVVMEGDGSNPHEHALVDQIAGWRFSTLGEALDHTISLLAG
jgi:nucleoside 2-deoxyribosyltransferase